jgi:uncharacterized protein YjbI with pentapeptide repeats
MIKPILNVKSLPELTTPLGQESFLENVKILGGDYTEVEIYDLSLEKVLLDGVVLNQAKIGDLKVVDAIFSKCSMAGAEIELSHFTRLEIKGVRLQGIHLAQARVIDSVFISSKMDGANLRFSRLKNVLFDSCDMSNVDFVGAELKNVVFKNCVLNSANFSQAKLENVDLSGSGIENIVISSEVIKEVFVDTGQAIYLSSIFGLKIRD